jgi:oligosaccharide repeat unit polymerase
MQFAAIALCVALGWIAYRKDRFLFNPLTMLFAVWTLILALASMRLYALFGATQRIYGYIFIGLFCFALGYFFIRFLAVHPGSLWGAGLRITGGAREYELRTKWVYLAAGICIVVFLLDFSVVANGIFHGEGLAAIRKMAQNPNSAMYARRSGMENAFRVLFVLPFSFALGPIVAYDLVGERRHLKLLALYLVIILLRVLTEGGRVVMAYFMLHILLAYMLRKDRLGIGAARQKKLKIALLIVLAAGLVLLVITTLARSGSQSLRHMYYYASMQPVMFETWSRITNGMGLKGYGLASLNGFLYVFPYALKNLLGMNAYPGHWGKVVSLIEATDSQWQWISGYGRANAFVSLFYFLYLDGRVAGIALGMALYGAVSCFSYHRAKWSPNYRNICVYIMIVQGLVFSLVRLQFANTSYALAFVYLWVMFQKTKAPDGAAEDSPACHERT